MLLFVGFVFFGALFYWTGYIVSGMNSDKAKPKLTAAQVKGELADFTDLKGRVDADGFSKHVAALLEPINFDKRKDI